MSELLRYLVIVMCMVWSFSLQAQPTDSMAVIDTVTLVSESASEYDWSTHPIWQLPIHEFKGTLKSGKDVDTHFEFYSILMLCLLLGLTRWFDIKYFNQILSYALLPQSVIKNKVLTGDYTGLSNAIMNIFFCLSWGFLLYYVSLELDIIEGAFSIKWPLLLGAGVGVVYLFKVSMLRLIGWCVDRKQLAKFCVNQILVVNKVIGVLAVPIIILLAFGNTFITRVSLFLLALVLLAMFLNRYARLWKVYQGLIASTYVHFFLYLCAFEILPILILVKILANQYTA